MNLKQIMQRQIESFINIIIMQAHYLQWVKREKADVTHSFYLFIVKIKHAKKLILLLGEKYLENLQVRGKGVKCNDTIIIYQEDLSVQWLLRYNLLVTLFFQSGNKKG